MRDSDVPAAERERERKEEGEREKLMRENVMRLCHTSLCVYVSDLTCHVTSFHIERVSS